MLSSFFIGAAIIISFVVVYALGTDHLDRLLRQRLEDETAVAKYWGIAWGAWTIVVSLAFGLTGLTELGQPISKLGPFVTGFGILFGVAIALSKFKSDDEDA